jgi:hypothetical protein
MPTELLANQSASGTTASNAESLSGVATHVHGHKVKPTRQGNSHHNRL